MGSKPSNEAIQIALEVLVDMVGVRHTLDLLAEACHDKAEHIRSNWQDKHTAAAWTQAAVRVKQCSVMEAVKFVSNDTYDALAGLPGNADSNPACKVENPT